MKKSASKIREDIARMQEQLRQAEKRDAERIGRVALRAGLAEIEIDETELQVAFEQLTKRFRGGQGAASGRKNDGGEKSSRGAPSALGANATAGGAGEA